MRKFEAFYYICHKKNIPSILEHGILSHNAIEERKLEHEVISDPSVMSRRDKILPGGRNLKDYVNLYFEPRNAMMYRLVCNWERKNLAVIQVSPSIIDSHGILFSDRNAAVSDADFFSHKEDLKKINRKDLKKVYWKDSDDTKQRMMAELLVPDRIPPSNIMGIYHYKEDQQFRENTRSFEPIIQPNMFFHPTFGRVISNRISILEGDMFFSEMQTFTISVNLKGIMGKGLASRTKYQFPDAYVRYQDDCKHGKLKIGRPTLYKRAIRIEEELADDRNQLKRVNGARWFLFLPTKRDWRENSRIDDIEASMQWLANNYREQGIESIALPALGCGLGNLNWSDVGPVMCHYLNRMDIRSCIYLPMGKNSPRETPDLLDSNFLLSYCPQSKSVP